MISSLSLLPGRQHQPTVIDLSGKHHKDFTKFPFHPSIQCITADFTQISSFKGFAELPLLKLLSLKGTPISSNQNLDIMALCFAPNLLSVNGVSVSEKRRNKAAKIKPKIQQLLLEGLTIATLSPLVVVSQSEEERIHVDMDSDEYLAKKAEISANEEKIFDLQRKLSELSTSQISMHSQKQEKHEGGEIVTFDIDELKAEVEAEQKGKDPKVHLLVESADQKGSSHLDDSTSSKPDDVQIDDLSDIVERKEICISPSVDGIIISETEKTH